MIMTRRFNVAFGLCIGLVVLLLWLTLQRESLVVPPVQYLILGSLIVFTLMFGVPLGGGFASLLPMVQFMIYLSLGLLPAAWLSFIGGWTHGIFRHWFGQWLEIKRPSSSLLDFFSVTAFNAVVQTAGIIAAALMFEQLGGSVPLLDFDVAQVGLPLVAAIGAYFFANHLIFVSFLKIGYPERVETYWQQLPRALLYEMVPIVFAPLMAVVYTRLGQGYFVLLIGMQVSASLVMYRLDQTRQRLEQRVRELGGLQAVGHTLSLSLELDEVLTAVYNQVSSLMPAAIFYVALYDEETATISFPLVIQDGQPIFRPTRPFTWGHGLTEYVLTRNRPLLINGNWEETIELIGLDRDKIGKGASWLGVPIRAGDQTVGIMSVQSHDTPSVYTQAHQDLLLTIAAQAGVAIQNVRLYEQIDSQLARRVQELDSIFRTTHDGILLLSKRWYVLSANRAFLDLFDLDEVDIPTADISLTEPALAYLAERIDFLPTELDIHLDDGQQNGGGTYKHRRVFSYDKRFVERTLTPVYDRDNKIDGWLLVFRDVTEEIKLANMRQEMTHMLVHDLRSPLALVLSGIELSLAQIQAESPLVESLHIAQRSGQRMLQLINNLLDVYKLENGNVLLQTEMMPPRYLLELACTEFESLAQETGIALQITVEEGLPPIPLDSDYISRVLHNLLDNAFKFTPNGGRISVWAKQGQPGWVQLGVTDTGCGIPTEVQARLFDKFEQWRQPGSRRRGSGLGLTYCRLAVQAHGGKLSVESNGRSGEGSTFIVSLPLRREE